MTALCTTMGHLLPDHTAPVWWVYPPDKMTALAYRMKGAAFAYEHLQQWNKQHLMEDQT